MGTPALTITSTGISGVAHLYEGTNKITVKITGTADAEVLDNGVVKDLPEDVSATVTLTTDVTFLMAGPGELSFDVATLSGGGAKIEVYVEKSHG